MDLRERLSLRLKARSLDRALAAGASPDTSEELTLRAHALVRADTRNEVAAALSRLAQGDGQRPLRRELERVATRLLDPGPVAPGGVALALGLLSDGARPLSRARLRTVLDGLEPGSSDQKTRMEGRTR